MAALFFCGNHYSKSHTTLPHHLYRKSMLQSKTDREEKTQSNIFVWIHISNAFNRIFIICSQSKPWRKVKDTFPEWKYNFFHKQTNKQQQQKSSKQCIQNLIHIKLWSANCLFITVDEQVFSYSRVKPELSNAKGKTSSGMRRSLGCQNWHYPKDHYRSFNAEKQHAVFIHHIFLIISSLCNIATDAQMCELQFKWEFVWDRPLHWIE